MAKKKVKVETETETETDSAIIIPEVFKRPKITANSKIMKSGGFMKATDATKAEYILTGDYNIDHARGLSHAIGLKKGSTVTIYGDSLAGKTTKVFKWIANWQKQGLVGALINLEDSFDPEWLRAQGGNPDALYVTEVPEFVDEAMQKALEALKGKYFDFIVTDSLHAVGTKREIDRTDTMEKEKPVAALAGKVTQFLRVAKPYMFFSKTVHVIIGHARINIDAGPMARGPQLMLTGGEHLYHESNDIFQVTRSVSKTRAPIENDKLIGHAMGVKAEKCRGPGLGLRFDEIFITGKGFNEAWSFINRYIAEPKMQKLLNQNGHRYSWVKEDGEKENFVSKNKMFYWFEDNHHELDRLKQAWDSPEEEIENETEPSTESAESSESVPEEVEG